jgi:hypothetical protein
MNRRFSRSPSYYAPRSFLGAVKAVTPIKQGTLMNWRRYREALLTGERPGTRVVRLIHRDSGLDESLPTDHLGRMAHEITARFVPMCTSLVAIIRTSAITIRTLLYIPWPSTSITKTP